MAHSKLRQLPRISYFEPEDPSFDEYIYCSGCRDYVYDMCPQHGPLLILPDTKVPEVTNYPPYVPRAALTIPKAFLHINRSCIPGAGLGVFSSVTLPNGVRFGPYRGVVKKYPDSSYCWQIFDKNNKPSHVVDGGDGHRSNWMRFINCSRNSKEQNLVAFQYKGHIYYRTIKIIPRNTELLVYYGSEAAHRLGIDLRFYNCQPKKSEPTPGTSNEKNKENNVDKSHNCKIGINLNKLSGKNTQNKFVGHQREQTPFTSSKSKESTLSSNNNPDDNKYEFAIKDDKISNKSISSTQSITTDLIPSTIENVKESIDLDVRKDRKLEHKTKKPFDINNNSNNAPKTSNNFTCDKCGKCFSTKNLLKKHILEENKIVQTKNANIQETTFLNDFFYCDICDFKTKVKSYIETHLKVHAAKRVYTCHVCRYKCTVKENLNKHIRTHTGEKPFSCHLCKYTSTQKGSLKEHIRTHTGEKPFSCNLCKYTCVQKGSLKEHIRTHTGEKPFSCNLCKYTCAHKGNLKEHIRTHTGEKPFSCNLCKYTSAHKGSLKEHIRTHTGEKPFSCNLCKYTSAHKGSLKEHIRTHTGEKPFSCNLCKYTCAHKGSLKRHLRTHS